MYLYIYIYIHVFIMIYSHVPHLFAARTLLFGDNSQNVEVSLNRKLVGKDIVVW